MAEEAAAQPNLVGPKQSNIKKILISVGIIFVVVGLLVGSAFAYGKLYTGKVLPGVYIGQYHVGGMTGAALQDMVENFNNRLAEEGLEFSVATDGGLQYFKIIGPAIEGNSLDLTGVDSEKTVERALAVGRSGGLWQNLWQPLYLRFFSNQSLPAEAVVEDEFVGAVEESLAPYADPARNANIKITSLMPLNFSVEPEQTGYIFDSADIKNSIYGRLSQLSLDSIPVVEKEFKPNLLVSDVQPLTSKLPEVLNYGNLALTYTDPQTNRKRDWSIGPTIYTNWLEVRRVEGAPVFGLNKEKVYTYLDTLRPLVDTVPIDAKFVLEGERVKEFQGSQTGLSLDEEKTYTDLDANFQLRNYATATGSAEVVNISVKEIEPDVKTADVNNLGITEIVGVGYSTFHDSHTNRIKNIANAVRRLNGVLIKPGEEFSANKYAGPYTTANGFLPEQVIKGNEIKPEVGGGMCQIGTTLFRMAMNTGVPITQRRNHSLVVGYYADPVNGNPGTDATLYEPSLDLKFVNDTGNYMLLQTSIDYKKQQLTFTLWGKGDGRKGSYTHPIVTKWIPAGKPQEIVSDTLKPGQRKCQGAFRGAVASFVYTIITPSGEKIDRTFESYYRPLPQTCLVGPTILSPSSTDGVVPGPLDVSDNP